MSKTIWKYTLDANTTIDTPDGAQFLSVHEQGASICVWALVDPSRPMTPRRLSVYGTGHPMPDDPGTYVGTALCDGGRYVFHVFEDR